jgi:hypothetical protein
MSSRKCVDKIRVEQEVKRGCGKTPYLIGAFWKARTG